MNQGVRDGKDEGKKREVNVGTSGWVEEAMVTKKNILGGIIFLLSVFSVYQGAVNQPTLHVGLKELFCERDGWVNVGEKCFQFFHPL